ncbi:hypothetical protein [Streptomyces profundus]|uniref:hypothetical protein n=1 Tax=Streptomyces profundus TaxID=2867410 RepID=UPI001D16F535|nr:hypothetical protein [Streptomyces sp. MA3_2.13]UED84859.1 hypothetical protein K4G22_12120 [Streptomyces sp. MA3_2.13]
MLVPKFPMPQVAEAFAGFAPRDAGPAKGQGAAGIAFAVDDARHAVARCGSTCTSNRTFFCDAFTR